MSGTQHTPGQIGIWNEPCNTPEDAKAELAKLVSGTDFRPVLPMLTGHDNLCVAVTGCGPRSEANARRLVAAWNACDGISTETLELVPRFTEAGIKTVQSVEAEVAALKAQRDELLAGLAWLEQFNPREGEGANERFERLGDAFYKDTGHLRPGKDASMACGISEEERIAIWQKWLDDGRNAASALIAKHKGAV